MIRTELPPAPDYLQNDDARAEWVRAGKYLLDAGALDELRLAYLELYCSFFGMVVMDMEAGNKPSNATLVQLRAMQRAYGLPSLPAAHRVH